MNSHGAIFRPLALAAGAALLLSACTGTGTDGQASDAASASLAAPETATAPGGDQLLEVLGVDGMTGRQMVDHLDRVAGPDRSSDVLASVRTAELLVSDGTREISVPLPEDDFYLSIAPYVDATHDCFYHSLTTCQGELTGVDLEVTITTAAGEVLHDGPVTTFDNGFAGFWLPRGSEGTIELSHEGRSATYPFATDEESPTCVTTVRLT